jgi:hypothetical protein
MEVAPRTVHLVGDVMRIGICSGIAAAIVLLSSAAWASVSVDFDLRVNFSAYKTYSWKQVQTGDRLWDQCVKDTIDGRLAEAGWTEVPTGGDVLVSVIGVARPERPSTGTLTEFPRAGWGDYGGGFGKTIVGRKTFEAGTLVVDLFDGRSNVLVLRAVATKAIASNRHGRFKKLDREVRKILTHVPLASKPGQGAVPTM